MEYNSSDSQEKSEGALLELESRYKNMSQDKLATEAVRIATMQIMSSSEFKKPRLARTAKYWNLYNGNTTKKLRQLFNVPIPVFAGMVDTLNAQHDTPIQLNFKEGDASDYFKVQKLNGAFKMEIMNSAQNSKWDSKLRLGRKNAIIEGRTFMEYNVTSDPDYFSELSVKNLKDFNFQPRGGLYLENHLFAGTDDVEKTRFELASGAQSGFYNKTQVQKLFQVCDNREYMPFGKQDSATKLERFKPLGLDPDNNSFIGESVYKLANHIVQIDGQRWYLCFHPWSMTWLRFEKWEENNGLYPWVSFATHEDDENFLSKSYGDDMYASADAIIAMFNQELTNREKRNFGARAYDEEMFKNVRLLDEAMHRPDALVPANTKGGTRRISEGIYEFKVGELGGTVNLIDWISGTIGRNTGATDLAQGSVQEVSKKASVTFAEQKSVSKRISWASQPFQDMMADLGKRYIYGLKDHMPSKMAIRLMGEGGYDWDEITRLDLDTKKDVDVLIVSTDQQMQDNEMKAKKRNEVLSAIGADPILAPTVNPQWRAEQLLRVGEYDDVDVASAMDTKTFNNKKALSKAAEAIQMILRDEKPLMWYGANAAFMQKIVDFANDKRSTLKGKFKILIEYAMSHSDIARQNIERVITEQGLAMASQPVPTEPAGGAGGPAAQAQQTPAAVNPGMSGGMSRAMSVGQAE